jgi:hypothetical protein
MFNMGSKSDSRFSVETVDDGNVSSTLSPEKKLLKAMLERSFADLCSNSDEKSKNEAIEWLTVPEMDDPAPFSFQFVCMHLDVDFSLAKKHVNKTINSATQPSNSE